MLDTVVYLDYSKMDELLQMKPFRIPRPQVYTEEELQKIILEQKSKAVLQNKNLNKDNLHLEKDSKQLDEMYEQLDENLENTEIAYEQLDEAPNKVILENGDIEITELEPEQEYAEIGETVDECGGSPPKHSSDRHNKRYYSDPMHHVPKEQQRTVDQKRKTSEQLYELKKHSPEPPNELTEPEGEIIIVYKHKPTLGIAIEGGANTRMPLPRIINIQPGGSAHESGGLKVGHIILEIDGRSMGGLEHKQAARAIAEAFKNKHTSQMAFVVCEDDEIRL